MTSLPYKEGFRFRFATLSRTFNSLTNSRDRILLEAESTMYVFKTKVTRRKNRRLERMFGKTRLTVHKQPFNGSLLEI